MKNTNFEKKISFKNLYAFGNKLPIDLSLSENPLGFSPKLRGFKWIKGINIKDYPDPKLTILKKAISKRFNLDISNIFISSGSEGILKILPSAVMERNDEAIIPELTFLMFEIVARLNGNIVVFSRMTPKYDIDLDDIKRKINKKTKMIFICNPNNPTGRVISKQKLIKFVQSIKPIVVVDEANIEFGGESIIDQTQKNKNLIVLRTFSKGYGLAGLRIGFAIADIDIIKRLEEFSQPFPINTLVEKAVIIALTDDKFLSKSKDLMNKERLFLTNSLRKRNFLVIDSDTNNVLVNVSHFNRKNNFIDRLNKEGVSVVRGSSFRGLNDNYIRISPRLRKINQLFINKIDLLLT